MTKSAIEVVLLRTEWAFQSLILRRENSLRGMGRKLLRSADLGMFLLLLGE